MKESVRLVLPALLAALGYVNPVGIVKDFTSGPSRRPGGTPPICHSRKMRTRTASAGNGKWSMRHHRSRCR